MNKIHLNKTLYKHITSGFIKNVTYFDEFVDEGCDLKSIITETHMWFPFESFSQWHPPMILHEGTTIWFKGMILHRNNGPAIHMDNGWWMWLKMGKAHRLDGPAFSIKGEEYWYYDGKRLDFPEWLDTAQKDKESDLERLFLLKMKYSAIHK